jgi:myo-inositol-1(or 4)-monophosphatase
MDPLLSTALEAAESAARIHLRHFGKVGVELAQKKAISDFVTQVDLEAQEAALDVIRRRHPDHLILAEETTPTDETVRSQALPESTPALNSAQGEGDRRLPQDGTPLWVVDPLDGTTNYLHRHPAFSSSVAMWRAASPGEVGPQGTPKGIIEAGAVVAARTGERWWARRGGGAWKNGRPVRVSRLRSLRTALVGTGFPFKAPDLVPRYLEEFRRILPASGGIRRCGSAALDLCYLAEGILDAFWEEEYLSPWDVAAGLVILQEAGGVASRLDGSAVDLRAGSVLAANSPQMLEELGGLVRGE